MNFQIQMPERAGGIAMSWLEVITVRTAGNSEFMEALEFCRQMNQSLKPEEKMSVKIYRNTNYDMDLSVHIYRDATELVPEKTACGIRLSKLLNRFGIVDHNVWRPVQI
jgi:hypothetical protein